MYQKTFKNYSVDIVNIFEEESQGYDGVTLFCILQGEAALVLQGAELSLRQQEMVVVNQYERYQISSDTGNIIIKVNISHRYFSRYYTNYAAARFCLDVEEGHEHRGLLREIIMRLAISKLQSNKETGLLEVNALLSNLLSLMIMYFKQSRAHIAESQQKTQSVRIKNTLDYLQDNYNKPLSLSLLAKISHTSPAYFSRLFSQEVGISFKTYLTQLRFMCCIDALEKTDKPLYQIVEENGFYDTRNFTALFKTQYLMTPNKYRSLYREGKSPVTGGFEFPVRNPPERPARFGKIRPSELLALLGNSLTAHEQMAELEPLSTEKWTIELPASDDVSLELPHPGYIVSIGRLEELLKAPVQQQVITAREQMSLQYIHVEHIISENTLPEGFPTDEICPSFSHYANADMAVEFLKKQGIALLISIHFQLSEEDMRSCTLRFLDFVAHNITQFGDDYVSSWAFSYHPNVDFFADSEARFLRLRSKIKAILPRMKTGVFYPFPLEKEAMAQVPLFTSHLIRNIDFLGFSANANDKVSHDGFAKEDIAGAEFFVEQHARNILGQLKKHDLSVPLFLQTWNTLTGDTRLTNGSFFRGALLMDTLLSLPLQIALVGFWINSEVQKETREDKRIDTSSLSLFYIGSTRRPMFHVLRLRERLNGVVLARGDNYIVTRKAQGYRVLLTHSVSFNPSLSLQNHLMTGFRKQINVAVTGMEQGSYQIKRHLFDQKHGALCHQFECQPTRFGRDSEVMAFIDVHSAPDLHLYDEDIAACWKVSVEMDVNAICLFEINKITTP